MFKVSSNLVRIIGRTRKGSGEGPNEDAIGWDEVGGLAFVADGMGGYSAGEVASGLVKETLLSTEAPVDLCAAALRAHARILEAGGGQTSAAGMGSTLVATTVAARAATVVWVGDSRAYLWRRGHLRAVTRDHSYAERLRDIEDLSETQLRTRPGHNLLLQALGKDTPSPSEVSVALRSGDWLLLCSDGVSGHLRDEEIAALLRSHRTLEDAADALIDGAVARGSLDDISVVLVDYAGSGKREFDWQWARRGGLWLSILCGVVLAVVIAVVSWWFEKRR